MNKNNRITFQFPENIKFENTAWYTKNLQREQFSNILFDLTKTRTAHSSFIGFLILMKHNLEKSGLFLNLILSKNMKSLLHQLKIYDHFSPIIIPTTNKKTA